MTEKQIIEYLGPYKTGPIRIEQRLKYEIGGLFSNRCTYSFEYSCDELGISWDNYGIIKSPKFYSDVYELFKKCNLDIEYLKAEQNSLESVPSDNKELKNFLTNYRQGTKTIDLLFIDEQWRRDFWFCERSDKLHFKFYLKEESRFIIQWSPGVIMLDLTMDSEDTTRSYEIAEVPGKKGIYNFNNLGFTATERVKAISDYYSQFNFSFSDNDINEIIRQLKDGNICTGDLLKDKGSRRSIPKSPRTESIVKPDDYDNLIDLSEEILGTNHTLFTRAIPALASLISIAGNIDIRENEEEISQYSKDILESFKNSGLQTKYCETFILKSIERAYHDFENDNYDEKILKASIIYFFEENNDSECYDSVFLDWISFALSLTKTINDEMFNELVVISSEFNLTKKEVKEKVIECGYSNFFNNYSEDTDNNEDNPHKNPGWKSDEFYLGILGLEVGATLEDIKEARNTLVKFFHPDNFANNEKKRISAEEHLKKVNNACDVLVYRYKEREEE
jgi:hypothetical protein